MQSTEFVKEIIDDGQVGRQQLLVVGLCMLLNVIDGFDITAMAVVAGVVAQELQLPPNELGLIFSFALAGMVAGAMFLAPMADVVGRRKLIVLSVFVVGVSILLTARATELTQFIALRFISGLGAGAIMACQATLTAEYSPEKYRSLSVAIATSGYPLGAMLTAVVAGTVLPEYGWRGMFLFGGVTTIILGLIAWAFMPESLKFLLEHRPSNALERINHILRRMKKSLLDELPAIETETRRTGIRSVPGNVGRLLSPMHRTTTLALWSVFFLSFTTLYFLMSWIPRLMEQSGYSGEEARFSFLLFNLGGFIGTLLLGAMSTRWKLTNLVFAFLLAAAAGMAIFANLPFWPFPQFMLIFIIGILMQGGFVGLYAAAAKVYPTEIRNTGIGWAIGLGRLGAVFGPAAAGFLIAAGFSMSTNFFLFAIPLGIAAVLSYWLNLK